jgi:hypothetical protein
LSARNAPLGGRGKKQPFSRCGKAIEALAVPQSPISHSWFALGCRTLKRTDGNDLSGRYFARTRPRPDRSKIFGRKRSNGHDVASKRTQAGLFVGCCAGSDEDLVLPAEPIAALEIMARPELRAPSIIAGRDRRRFGYPLAHCQRRSFGVALPRHMRFGGCVTPSRAASAGFRLVASARRLGEEFLRPLAPARSECPSSRCRARDRQFHRSEAPPELAPEERHAL